CEARENDRDATPFTVSYRPLEWSEVQALAAAESVELFRTAGQIVIRMPRAVATTPLQIVPV
ncbi:MAG: hypothetical protein M3150_06385, partial [Pseudomonadota bacterium]|nr:hypothetical protein [Pseudomonadota bacterium]